VPTTLVHIGYHKTGTNWLQEEVFADPSTGYRWLGKRPLSHPVHRLVRDRPLEFDAGALREEFEPMLRSAEDAGLLPVVSFPRLSGHAFSGGYDSQELADRLAAVFPEARVLIVIREQRSMIVSAYKQYVPAGGVCTVERFIAADPESRRVPRFDFGHFAYDRLIRYYQSLFGRESVLVLPYEQFVRDGRSFVAAIGEFAGRAIPAERLAALPYGKRSNRAQAALAVEWSRPLNMFGRRSDLNPAPVFQSKLLFSLAKQIRRLDPATVPVLRDRAERSEADLRRVVADAVGDRYVESNRATAELTGIDLSAFGWMIQ
jgi:sulfotransferase family protein